MKKVYAINGSPRRNRNTATLLDKVLEGCRDAFPGMVETERINLGDAHGHEGKEHGNAEGVVGCGGDELFDLVRLQPVSITPFAWIGNQDAIINGNAMRG